MPFISLLGTLFHFFFYPFKPLHFLCASSNLRCVYTFEVTNEFARRFVRAEEQIFINGTGINEPSSLLITAETGRSIDTTDTLSYADIIALYFATKPKFRKNGVWLMNDNNGLTLRTLKKTRMAITCGGSLMTQSIAGQWLSRHICRI